MAAKAARITARFREMYPNSDSPRVVRAPGRVNLIGEHTDYNLGFVLPVGIGLECQVAAAPSGDQWIRVYADDLAAGTQIHVDGIADARPREDWSDYVIGVARELQRRGYSLEGKNVLIRSSVPQGAGLSSSAALEVAMALALANVEDRQALAELCRDAEADFAGVPCGIMDQFASVFSESGSAMLLDCRSLERRTVKLPEGATLVAVDSGVKHSLGTSAYRARVEECAEAARAIRAVDPQVASLRDATEVHLDIEMSAVARKRARHVVSENARVLAFVAAAGRGEAEEMGRLMIASHKSLTDDYEVGCEALDTLVEVARKIEGVYGARMTGAGFGGCIVVLLNKDAMQEFLNAVPSEYSSRCGFEATIYQANPSAGAGVIS